MDVREAERQAIHSTLRILQLDDSPADLGLVARALREMERPVAIEQVTTEAAFREALARCAPDVVLSDFSMPGFSGQAALEIALQLAPDTAFIFVSGAIGEEAAIQAMQRGAADYVHKDRLGRLKPAIEHALREVEGRRERRRMERALRESEARFRSLVESTSDWIWEWSPTEGDMYSNSGIARLLGIQPEALFGKNSLDFMLEDDRRIVLDALPGLMAAKKGWKNWVLRWRHIDGSVRYLESTAEPMLDEAGELTGYRGIDRDVTLRIRQARIQAVLTQLGNAVLRAKSSQELLDSICQVAVEHGGFTAAAIGCPLPDNTLTMVASAGDAKVTRTVDAIGPLALEDTPHDPHIPVQAFLRRHRVLVRDYQHSDASAATRETMAGIGVVSHIALPIGAPPWAVLCLFSATAQDFDAEEIGLLERLTAEIDYAHDFIAKSERLEYLAYHHPVSGLPNRTRFGEWIVQQIEGGPHWVAMTEPDRFRYFVSSRGHAFSEHLVCALGERLKSLLPAGALLAHVSDGAFVFAYPADGGIDEAADFVRALIASCCQSPLLIDGEDVQLRLHASVLLAPLHCDTAASIERSLVAVLDEAQKRDEPVQPFTEDVSLRTSRHASLERELREALAEDGFELYLQPKFEAKTGRLIGAEALLRWRHPERGLVSPAQFIPVLEDTGMIVEAGSWIRRNGLSIWRRWRELGQGGLRLAVNVSARELLHVGFLDDCAALLEPLRGDHGLDMEITESMVMDDIGKCIRVLTGLHGLGSQIHIDDFGTGYSSLNYLSRLPVDALKVDQSFIAALVESPDALALVNNFIGLAHSLQLSVVAEGVENEEQAKMLRLLRCDVLQGYHLGRPMPAAEFEARLLS